MSEHSPDRASLTTRQLPEMRLSTADNPLTAPQPPPADLSNAQRAQYRFQVEGNVIITGGAGTLALESARALLEHGASGLALWDLDPTPALPAVTALHARFPDRRLTTCTVDVRSEESIAAAMRDTLAVLGTISTLCCFAGVVDCTPALATSTASFRRVQDVNLTGSFLCAQAAARQMVAQNTGGSIVLTASISARATNFPQPQAAYNASKAGVVSLVKSLAAEWSAHGVRVNAVSPGYMDTILNEGEGLERARRVWCERNPMGRMGDPWEVTGVVVLLCSRAGRYVNGADFVVDGGATVF